jgi:hypothetical protein
MWALAVAICLGASALTCAVVQTKQLYLTEDECLAVGAIVTHFQSTQGRRAAVDCKETELPEPPKKHQRGS